MRIYVLGDSISLHYGPYLQARLGGAITTVRKEAEEEALLDLDHPQGRKLQKLSLTHFAQHVRSKRDFLRRNLSRGDVDFQKSCSKNAIIACFGHTSSQLVLTFQ